MYRTGLSHKEYRKAQNELHWSKYLDALERARQGFEAEVFDWDICAMALADAKRELSLAAKFKDVR